jgi:hypothetical protein
MAIPRETTQIVVGVVVVDTVARIIVVVVVVVVVDTAVRIIGVDACIKEVLIVR